MKHTLIMKTHYISLLLVFYCVFHYPAFAQTNMHDSTGFNKIAQIADAIKHQYAPDSRTALFELQASGNSAQGQYTLTTTEAEALSAFQRRLADQHIDETKITINLLPDNSVGKNVSGVVNLSVAELRVTPSNQAELASQILLGATVDLLAYDGEYYRARTPEGYIAWIKAASIVPMSEMESEAWKSADKVIFTADFGHSYSHPDSRSLRVSDLVMGNILSVLGESEGFYQVQYPDGRLAYINKELALPFDEWLGTRKVTADSILAIAKSMMGVPYVWGGTSVKGVDCSGFTKTAYFMNGIIIPRDASQQVLAGQPIDILTDGVLDTDKALQNLKPADLLFFASGSGRSPDARITHVALYLGNGEFIQSAGTVRINSMLPTAANYNDFQTRTLVSARRYIGQDGDDPGLQPVATNRFYFPTTEN